MATGFTVYKFLYINFKKNKGSSKKNVSIININSVFILKSTVYIYPYLSYIKISYSFDYFAFLIYNLNLFLFGFYYQVLKLFKQLGFIIVLYNDYLIIFLLKTKIIFIKKKISIKKIILINLL